MEKRIKQNLERAGFRLGDVREFLGLSEEEQRLVELRLAVSKAVRRLRERHKLTQQQLADRIGSSPSRVNKLENGSVDVSLDLLFRGLFALGGGLNDVNRPASTRSRAAAPNRSSRKRAASA